MKYSVQAKRLFPALGFVFLILIYHLNNYHFYPNASGNLGHDYSYFLPHLLNGVYWFRNNGMFEVPWFTPGFCGGLPFFPNPQNIYYSLPQLLTFFIAPIHAVYISVLIFASLGFIGTYLLARKIFMVSIPAAFLGASIFLFNDFFTSRMIIGHLTYQIFALIPLLAWSLLYKNDEDVYPRQYELVRILFAGIILAYMFYAGAANYILPILFAQVCLWLVFGIIFQNGIRFWPRLIFAGFFSLLLSSPKLYPAILFISDFRSNAYTLPGFDGIWTSIVNICQMLFGAYETSISKNFINFPFKLSQHEFEYGISIVPLLLLFIFPVYLISSLFVKKNITFHETKIRFLYLLILALALVTPVALNTFYPTWSEFLKKLPYINVSTSLIRWISIYIPMLSIISSLAVDQIKADWLKIILSLGCVVYVIFSNTISDKSYYSNEQYSPEIIVNAWNLDAPNIMNIDSLPDSDGIYSYLGRNDLLAIGSSQLNCYEPIFGYGMETFPVGNLHIGSIFDYDDTSYNIKNPACYIFPEENQCASGDHFLKSELEKIELFTNYKPFEFSMPLQQKILNIIGLLTLILSILISVSIVFLSLVKRLRRG